MSTNHHTAVAANAPVIIATVNNPLGQLDAALSDILNTDLTMKTGAVDRAAVLADGVVTLAKLEDIAEGSVIVGGPAAAPVLVDAKTSGQILVGNGTTVVSVAVSNDATLAANGALTIAAGAVEMTMLATAVTDAIAASGLDAGQLAAIVKADELPDYAVAATYVENMLDNGNLQTAAPLQMTHMETNGAYNSRQSVSGIADFTALGINYAWRLTPPNVASPNDYCQARMVLTEQIAGVGFLANDYVLVGNFVYASDGATWFGSNYTYLYVDGGIYSTGRTTGTVQVTTNLRFEWMKCRLPASFTAVTTINIGGNKCFYAGGRTVYQSGAFLHRSAVPIATPTLGTIAEYTDWAHGGSAVGSISAEWQQFLDYDPRLTLLESATSGLVRQVTVANSDRITISGDSYTEAAYALKDKAWLSRVSELLDYVMESDAVSGGQYSNSLDRIWENYNLYGAGYQDSYTRYAIGAYWTNDLKYMSYADYYADIATWCEVVMGLGATPLIATEHRTDQKHQAQLRQLARKYGGDVLLISSEAQTLQGTNYAPFWAGEHPATRTNSLYVGAYLEYLRTLPRPYQALKIFRKRAAYTPAVDRDLMYSDNLERATKWQEISVGHNAIDPASNTDMARYDSVPGGGYNIVRVESEYLALVAGNAVAFEDYALLDVTLPVTCRNLTQLTLTLDGTLTGITVYARNVLTAPRPNLVRYQAFTVGVQTGVTPGATYTVSSGGGAVNGQTYTVIAYIAAEGIVTMSPHDTDENKDGPAGVLTRASGAGPVTMNFTAVGTGYDAEWYARKNTPTGNWVEVNDAGGRVYVLAALELLGYVQYDRVQYLITKTGSFTISAVSVISYGGTLKQQNPLSVPFGLRRAKGALLLDDTFSDADWANWTATGVAANNATADTNYPAGITKVATLNATSDSLAQALAFAAADYDREAIIEVWARVWVPVFSGTYPADASITTETYDDGRLLVTLDWGATVITTHVDRVGLHWTRVQLPIIVPATATGVGLELATQDSKVLELARCIVKLME